MTHTFDAIDIDVAEEKSGVCQSWTLDNDEPLRIQMPEMTPDWEASTPQRLDVVLGLQPESRAEVFTGHQPAGVSQHRHNELAAGDGVFVVACLAGTKGIALNGVGGR